MQRCEASLVREKRSKRGIYRETNGENDDGDGTGNEQAQDLGQAGISQIPDKLVAYLLLQKTGELNEHLQNSRDDCNEWMTRKPTPGTVQCNQQPSIQT